MGLGLGELLSQCDSDWEWHSLYVILVHHGSLRLIMSVPDLYTWYIPVHF